MKAILRFDNVDLYRELAFSDGDVVTIGREKDNAVALELGVLSRHHARIFTQGGACFVEDLDSANGTFHCGKQLCRTQRRFSRTATSSALARSR